MASPIGFVCEFAVDHRRVFESFNLGELFEEMPSVKTIERNIDGVSRDDFPIDDDISLADFDIPEQLLHGVNPPRDGFLVRVWSAMISALFPGEVFPTLIPNLDAFCEGESLPAGQAGK